MIFIQNCEKWFMNIIKLWKKSETFHILSVVVIFFFGKIVVVVSIRIPNSILFKRWKTRRKARKYWEKREMKIFKIIIMFLGANKINLSHKAFNRSQHEVFPVLKRTFSLYGWVPLTHTLKLDRGKTNFLRLQHHSLYHSGCCGSDCDFSTVGYLVWNGRFCCYLRIFHITEKGKLCFCQKKYK